MAKANPFRFSTKYQDDETDLLYYGYRYYNASKGRWISRDRLAEAGGKNLYSFVGNQPLGRVDVLGQQGFEWLDALEVDFSEDAEHKPGGQTSWAYFTPKAQYYSVNGCCYGVRLSGGIAQPQILYIPGTALGEDVLTHEREHVRLHFKPAYTDYDSAARALGKPCMTKGRALCIQRVIESQLATEYRFRAHVDGLNYDWRDYGWKIPDSQTLWNALQTSLKMYGDAQDATAAAIAACPAG